MRESTMFYLFVQELNYFPFFFIQTKAKGEFCIENEAITSCASMHFFVERFKAFYLNDNEGVKMVK